MLENESIWPVLGILAISQVLYNYSDVISRRHLANGEWSLRSVFRPWLAWYYAVRSAAVVGTLVSPRPLNTASTRWGRKCMRSSCSTMPTTRLP